VTASECFRVPERILERYKNDRSPSLEELMKVCLTRRPFLPTELTNEPVQYSTARRRKHYD
jgi:hypothetical protein